MQVILRIIASTLLMALTLALSSCGDGTSHRQGDRAHQNEDDLVVAEEFAVRGHRDSVSAICFPKGNTIFISGSWDRRVQWWNRKTRKVIYRVKMPSQVESMASSPASGLLAVGCDDEKVYLVDLKTRKTIATIPTSQSLSHIAISPDGRILACAGGEGTIKLYRFPDMVPMDSLDGGQVLWWATFSPDSRQVAFCSESIPSSRVGVWNMQTSRFQWQDKSSGVRSGCVSVLFSASGDMLLGGGYDGYVRVWRARDGRLLGRVRVAKALIWSMANFPDGRYVAVASSFTVAVLSLPSCRMVWQWVSRDPNKSSPYSVAVSPDGATLVVGFFEGPIRAWHVNLARLGDENPAALPRD